MTRKPLLDLIPEILQYISKYEESLQYNLRLYRVVEGQIKAEIEESMRLEILSPPALKRALQRIPSINILKKATDKLSKVYAEQVLRLTEKESDQKLMDHIVKISGFDATMMAANKMWNLTKMAAIEPFVQDGEQRFRVLAGHQFLPFSDDPVNPMNMTVFIKLLGQISKNVVDNRQYIQDNGLLVTEDDEIKQVDLYQLFSDKEIIIIDSDGSVRIDIMNELGMNGLNPFGVIPQTYLNKSTHELVPFPDTTGLDISIVIPKLLADANYAIQFQSHSMIWTKNADLGNQEANPDSIIDLGDSNGEAGDPEIGIITPSVDVQSILSLAEFQMAGYFSSIGIKGASMKGMLPGREASGIAKAMDEGDTSAELKAQTEYFRSVEQRFWKKFAIIQNYLSSQNLVEEKRKFTPTFSENFSILFKELRPIETSQEKTVRVQAQRDLGIIDKAAMVKEFNPDFSEDQILARLSRVEKEKKEAMDNMQEMGVSLGGNTTENNNQDSNNTESEPEGSSSDGNN